MFFLNCHHCRCYFKQVPMQSTVSDQAVEEMAQRLGVSACAIRMVSNPKTRNYRVYVQRQGRKKRLIEAPKTILKRIQRSLLDSVFSHVHSSTWSHGFCPGRSIFSHAVLHTRKNVVVTMDIKDFFPSVNLQKIHPILRRFFPDESELELAMQLVTRNGRLPQGAPTSPHLANLVFSAIDETIASSIGGRWAYSRYADDLAFSGDDSTGMLIDTVSEIALRNGFCIATKKTRVMRQHHRQKVTGLVVNHGLNLPREKRKNWRATLHRISTQGVEAAEPHCPFKLNGFAAFHMGLDKFKKAQA